MNAFHCICCHRKIEFVPGIVHVNYCSVEGLIISSLSRRCSDDALMPLNALGAGAVQKKRAIDSVIRINPSMGEGGGDV